MILEGIFCRAMEGLTSGVVLAGFAIALGATDLEIGLLAAIPFLAQLAHIPAIAILARYPDRKRVCVSLSVLARAAFPLIALVAFLPWDGVALRQVDVVIAILIAYSIAATLSGAAWQVWVRELVPREQLGAYFGKRMGILAAIGLIVLLASGQFLAYWNTNHADRALEAFGILFLIGGILGWVSSAIASRAPSAAAPATVARDLRAALKAPLSSPNYRAVLIFLGVWGFAANLSLPFIAVVLLTRMGYGFGVVSALAALSLAANVIGFKMWGPLTDRFGNKPVLGVSASIFLAAMLGWAFLPQNASVIVLVGAAAVHVILGLAVSGLDVASNGIVMKLAPDDEAPAYLASASVVRALTAGIAPLVGGLAATFLAGREFAIRFTWTAPSGETSLTVMRFAHYDLLFIASAVLGLYALHRLLGFKEPGEAPQSEVVRALRREALTFSSIAGMRQFAHMGSYLVVAAYVFERPSTLARRLVPALRPKRPV